MKTIKIKKERNGQMLITFDKIKPFENTCKVTGAKEWVTLTIAYIPKDKVLDIVDFRERFSKPTNSLIEDIAQTAFDEIMQDCEPAYLEVTAYLEGNPHLTDWNVKVSTPNK